MLSMIVDMGFHATHRKSRDLARAEDTLGGG
jgi:hypothetical protein